MAGTVEIETGTVTSEEFLKLVKRFKEFRIRFKTDNLPPFEYWYPVLNKKELRWWVRMNKAIVTYEIRYNSKVSKELGGNMNDIVYIMNMKMTILDKFQKQ